MSAPYTNEPEQADEAAAKLAQQRAMFNKNNPDHPLGRASDVDFHAALESARLFAEGTGPFSVIQEWIKDTPEVEAMIAVGQAFGPWVTAASFVYGLYSDWQRKKQDKEMAKKIIRDVAAAVDGMMNRAVESVKKFINEEKIKTSLENLGGLQETLANLMCLSADQDFANIDTTLVGLLLINCNTLIISFEGIFNESIDASNSAQATIMYGHIVDSIQLKNQTLAWQDKTLPHGTSSLAKDGLLKLQKHLDILLPAVRKTTDKQFSGMGSQFIELDNGGNIIRPQIRPGPRPPVGRRIHLFFYYFRGEVQGDLHFLGTTEEQFIGSTKQAEVRDTMEKRKEEEYLKATERLRAMGDEQKMVLDDLDILIKEEAPTAAPSS